MSSNMSSVEPDELQPPCRVFIENPAGSTTKTHHDEERLVPTRVEEVSAPYAYAYGFVIGVPSGDGDCLDCFVLSDRPLQTGDVVDCHPVALLEQYENELVDHDVIAVPVGEASRIAELDINAVEATLRSFIERVFRHDSSRVLRVGRLTDAASATALIRELTPS